MKMRPMTTRPLVRCCRTPASLLEHLARVRVRVRVRVGVRVRVRVRVVRGRKKG